jgi:hypothetical protein
MLKEFTIGVSHTINLGHYESMRIEASVTLAATEDFQPDAFPEAWAELKEKAQTELRSLLRETYLKQKRKNGNDQREPASDTSG